MSNPYRRWTEDRLAVELSRVVNRAAKMSEELKRRARQRLREEDRVLEGERTKRRDEVGFRLAHRGRVTS